MRANATIFYDALDTLRKTGGLGIHECDPEYLNQTASRVCRNGLHLIFMTDNRKALVYNRIIVAVST